MPFVLPRMNVLPQLVAHSQGLCSAILVQGKHLPPVVWYFNLCSVHVRVLYILAESNTLEKKKERERDIPLLILAQCMPPLCLLKIASSE